MNQARTPRTEANTGIKHLGRRAMARVCKGPKPAGQGPDGRTPSREHTEARWHLRASQLAKDPLRIRLAERLLSRAAALVGRAT